MTVKELMLSHLVNGNVRLVNDCEPSGENLTDIIRNDWSPMKDYYDEEVVYIQAGIERQSKNLLCYFTEIHIEMEDR